MSEKQPLRYQGSKYLYNWGNKNKTVKYESITYMIDEEETVAGIFGYEQNYQHFFIPRSIKHETKEYNVIIIMNGAFRYANIKSIEFASDSQLQTIDNNAF